MVRGIHRWTVIAPHAQRASKAANTPNWWRHHERAIESQWDCARDWHGEHGATCRPSLHIGLLVDLFNTLLWKNLCPFSPKSTQSSYNHVQYVNGIFTRVYCTLCAVLMPPALIGLIDSFTHKLNGCYRYNSCLNVHILIKATQIHFLLIM